MKNKLSIIIAHYYPNTTDYVNPLFKTLDAISKDFNKNKNLEVIIADDGSHYSKSIVDNYSKKIDIPNDIRSIYVLEDEKLKSFLIKNSLNYDFIKKWVYLPKLIKCMAKSRVLNHASKLSNNAQLLFLDDDNYFISENSTNNVLELFNDYDFIVGQIKDNNGRFRQFSSNRVQGTSIAIRKDILFNIKGFGEWTEEYSCGIDSDLWIKIYNYFKEQKTLKACYTNKISTYDSHSKRWGKYTKFFKEFRLKREFNRLYKCKNYKNKKYNLSRNKKLWIENLI